jgi:glycine oxidase
MCEDWYFFMENDEFDIVLIGAGVIGLSLAFRLKRLNKNLKIAVLGDPMNSLMASRAAAGMLAPFGECEQADRFFDFCRQSLDKYPGFIEELASVSDLFVFFSMQGSLMPSAFYGDGWEDRKRFLKQENIPHEVWNPATVRERAPHLSENCGEVLWVGEGQVNNRQLHDALVAAARVLGITVLEKNVSGFIRDDSAIESAVTDSGNIKGKKFVLASGSWSQQLGKILEVSLPMKPVKGQMCRVQVEDGLLEYTVHGLLTYIAPWRGGHGFVIGSTMEDRGFDPSVEDEVIEGLIERASAILPCLKEAPLVESWTGLRPAAEDLMPIMGKSVRYQNLYYSTGHYRNGILQTPNQADYVAGIILETLQNEIAEFSPSRYRL